MNELENLVRDALVAHELQAADGERLLAQVRERSARRRRHGWSAAALAAAATAAVIAVVAVVAVQAQRDTVSAPPAEAATTGLQLTPSPTPTPTPETQTVSYHGIEITVPASWPLNAVRCATPMADTVLVGLTSFQACLVVSPPENLTVVTLLGYPPDSALAAVATDETSIDGHPARRGVGVPAGLGQTEQAVLIVPDVEVIVSIESPDMAYAERLLDTVRVVEVDSVGCRDHVDMLTTPVSERPGATDALVPGAPTSASICRYSADWLGASVAVALADLDGLVEILNSLPTGTSTPGPEFFNSAEGCAEDEHRGFIVQFAYSDGPPVDVYVRISGCPVLSASNGARTTKVDESLMRFLLDRVGYDAGFPDSRNLR